MTNSMERFPEFRISTICINDTWIKVEMAMATELEKLNIHPNESSQNIELKEKQKL